MDPLGHENKKNSRVQRKNKTGWGSGPFREAATRKKKNRCLNVRLQDGDPSKPEKLSWIGTRGRVSILRISLLVWGIPRGKFERREAREVC